MHKIIYFKQKCNLWSSFFLYMDYFIDEKVIDGPDCSISLLQVSNDAWCSLRWFSCGLHYMQWFFLNLIHIANRFPFILNLEVHQHRGRTLTCLDVLEHVCFMCCCGCVCVSVYAWSRGELLANWHSNYCVPTFLSLPHSCCVTKAGKASGQWDPAEGFWGPLIVDMREWTGVIATQ